jgi:2-polyprenyl-3-methyl-5-hydroxy-6-metoxy-1,4-benzoquinol methylase
VLGDIVILSKFQKAAVQRFNKKTCDGLMAYETKPCLCGSTCFDNIFKYDRYGLWHPTVICRGCGLIQSNPRLLDVEYSRFYSSDEYRVLYEGENFLDFCKLRYNKSNHIFERLLPIMTELGLNSVLEFGCGGGWNLLPFHEKGYRLIGYDYSHGLIQQGRSLGLNLINGSFEKLKQNSDKFDVIILNHVVEHFTDIFHNLQLITEHLSDKGVIYIGVPNIDNFAKSQFQNAHVYYFSPRTFKYYISLCDLEILDFGSAETIHMYGIYKKAKNNKITQENPLSSEYEIMKKKIFKAKLKSFVAGFLEKVGLKNFVKRLIGFFR